jgi:hypothetical protein
VSERLEFVRRWEEGERVVDLCHEFGISRKTDYKLRERYERLGARALFDRSQPHAAGGLNRSVIVIRRCLPTSVNRVAVVVRQDGSPARPHSG